MEIVNLLLNAFFQVFVFSFIPLCWWFITARKKESFFHWIGLFSIKRNYMIIIVVIIAFCLICWLMQVYIVPFLLPPGSTIQQSYSGEGNSAIIPILIFGMVQTGLSEEILFRGFFLKRLCNKIPFEQANFIQSLVFGSIHGLGFFMMTTPFKAFLIVLVTALPAWIFGYLNEKKCDGSIIPSYLCHGIGNCFISLLSAFLIL